MDRSGYYMDAHVGSFRAWAALFVNGERPLKQQWDSPKWGRRSFETIEDGYRSFDWPFAVRVPGDAQATRGRSFEANSSVLDHLARLLSGA